MWAWDGRGLKDRDVPVPAVGHDLRYVHAVVAGGEEIGLACAGFAEASEVPRTHQPFPGAYIDGVCGQDRRTGKMVCLPTREMDETWLCANQALMPAPAVEVR